MESRGCRLVAPNFEEIDMKMRFAVMMLLVLGVLVLAACSSQGATATPTEPMEVTLNATDIAFDKNRIEAVAGRPVSLTLHNAGVLEHDFTIIEMPHDGEVSTTEMEDEMGGHDMSNVTEEMDIHVAAPTDQSNTIEFTPTTPGEYEYYCTVAGHKEAGMVGTLVVEAP